MPEQTTFNAPVTAAKIHRVLDGLELSATSRVFDAGCGTGELLIQLHERYGCLGTGIDTEVRLIEKANASAAARGAERNSFIHGDATTFQPNVPFDLAICVGSTHAYGGFAKTLAALLPVVSDLGHILIGDIYWKQPPDEAYLALLGEKATDHTDHAGNALAGADAGLELAYATTANDDEWDDFESRFWTLKTRATIKIVDPDERAKQTEWLRRWREGYLRWGRQTMGFGLYLFAKDSSRPPE